MSIRTTVQTFLELVSSDPAQTLDLLDPDLVWELNGQVQTESAAAFVERQRADLATGTAETDVQTMIVGDDAAAVFGSATFTPHGDGTPMRLCLAEAFELSGRRITRIRDVMTPAG